jgi:uncharacterized protein YcaQ
VQADPIRSPARAQDLILRHRVIGYRAGDLERRYASLDIEEDFLYAYGFLPGPIGQLLRNRNASDLPDFERKVLEKVRATASVHPRELDAHFGSERIVNAWGGYSKSTKRALERLHFRGFLRIARRENGIRIYEATRDAVELASPEERFRKLVLVVAIVLAPIAEKTLTSIASYLRRWIPEIANHRAVITDLVRAGEVTKESVDGLAYLWPAGNRMPTEVAQQVRFLAPFDPVVWSRTRFEHLWGWPYRFEAYTPPAKRIRGYYAMPLLWGANVIGWANARVVDRKLKVELGFVKGRPKERQFRLEAEAEMNRLKTFLGLSSE